MSTQLRTIAPSRADDRAQMSKLTDQVRETETSRTTTVRIGAREAELPVAVAEALLDVLDRLASGDGVVVSSVDEYVTTGRAASMLGVSRTFVSRLLDDEVLPFEYRGTHRRIRVTAVLAYLDQRRQERTAALEELGRLSREAGLYDDDF